MNKTNSHLRLADYNYILPPGAIAQEPIQPRDAARMLVVDRRTGKLTDSRFKNLANYLRSSDVLVINNTQVMKARVFGEISGRSQNVEIFFVAPISEKVWEAMIRPGRRVHEGDRINLKNGPTLRVGKTRASGLRLIELETEAAVTVSEVLKQHGHLPLPPYIKRPVCQSDEIDYQTIYARRSGAVAAPTAGLHFTDEVFASLDKAGIEVVEITLHVGMGTFIPIRTENPLDHQMKAENYEITKGAAEKLNQAQKEGRRIVVVGTTTMRALEHSFTKNRKFVNGKAKTDLYIVPGYHFAVADVLLTNFHLPQTTLMFLVSAFASREIVLDSYQYALQQGYRFYSYGDCTLFL